MTNATPATPADSTPETRTGFTPLARTGLHVVKATRKPASVLAADWERPAWETPIHALIMAQKRLVSAQAEIADLEAQAQAEIAERGISVYAIRGGFAYGTAAKVVTEWAPKTPKAITEACSDEHGRPDEEKLVAFDLLFAAKNARQYVTAQTEEAEFGFWRVDGIDD